MLQLDDLSFSFGDHVLFEHVTLSIQKNEKVGFIGRNGAGKSTLFKLIIGQEEPSSGKLIIPKGYQIGYLDQHIRFTHPTVLEEAISVLADTSGQEDYKAKKILLGLGFTEEDLDKSISLFSGGYQLRLHLAKVLLKEPHLLLLDEPTNYLDLISIHWLKNYLKNYPGEVICITHDREFIDAIATSIMGLHRKKIKKLKGSTADYFQMILQEEEQHEKNRINVQKSRAFTIFH